MHPPKKSTEGKKSPKIQFTYQKTNDVGNKNDGNFHTKQKGKSQY